MNREELKQLLKEILLITIFYLVVKLFFIYAESIPRDCYFETGTIENEWGGNKYYNIWYKNREGISRHIRLTDTPPTTVTKDVSEISWGATPEENIAFRWCFIPSVNQTRIRGAWTWV